MGSCYAQPVANNELRSEITKKFDNFDFRISPSDTFTFLQRAKRELTGSCAPDIFMEKLYQGYRSFMIEAAVQIASSKKSPEKGKFIPKLTPPPLVDEMWCLAILYSQKYQELCQLLVGGTIDRAPAIRPTGFQEIKKLWPDYEQDLWRLDSKFTIWVYNKDLALVLNMLYDKIMEVKIALTDEIHVYKKNLERDLNNIQEIFKVLYSKSNLDRPASEIPDGHENFNPEKKDSPNEIYQKILNSLPCDFTHLVELKYSVGDKAGYYIEEYARFMTLIYFAKYILTPSEEVDHVWHLHQSFTVEYREFCKRLYGKFIYHIPTAGGDADAIKYRQFYSKTLNFYKFIFKVSPPIGLWPSVEDRFNPEKFVGSWFSLLRIFLCTIRVLDMHKTNRPDDVPGEILSAYFSWTGRTLFKKRSYNISLNKETKLRNGCTTNDYWYAGGCAIIMGVAGGGGCGGSGYEGGATGCGVGNACEGPNPTRVRGGLGCGGCGGGCGGG